MEKEGKGQNLKKRAGGRKFGDQTYPPPPLVLPQDMVVISDSTSWTLLSMEVESQEYLSPWSSK